MKIQLSDSGARPFRKLLWDKDFEPPNMPSKEKYVRFKVLATINEYPDFDSEEEIIQYAERWSPQGKRMLDEEKQALRRAIAGLFEEGHLIESFPFPPDPRHLGRRLLSLLNGRDDR
jgi:hypothetical protein